MMHELTKQLQNELIHASVKADHSPTDTAFLPVLLSSDKGSFGSAGGCLSVVGFSYRLVVKQPACS